MYTMEQGTNQFKIRRVNIEKVFFPIEKLAKLRFQKGRKNKESELPYHRLETPRRRMVIPRLSTHTYTILKAILSQF